MSLVKRGSRHELSPLHCFPYFVAHSPLPFLRSSYMVGNWVCIPYSRQRSAQLPILTAHLLLLCLYFHTVRQSFGHGSGTNHYGKTVCDSTLHPDTGKPIFLPFRMACFVPTNLLVAAGMLMPNPTVKSIMFWQWANQSVNVAFNYANANKTIEMDMKETAGRSLFHFSLPLVASWTKDDAIFDQRNGQSIDVFSIFCIMYNSCLCVGSDDVVLFGCGIEPAGSSYDIHLPRTAHHLGPPCSLHRRRSCRNRQCLFDARKGDQRGYRRL